MPQTNSLTLSLVPSVNFCCWDSPMTVRASQLKWMTSSANRRKNKFWFKIKFYSKMVPIFQAPSKRLLSFTSLGSMPSGSLFLEKLFFPSPCYCFIRGSVAKLDGSYSTSMWVPSTLMPMLSVLSLVARISSTKHNQIVISQSRAFNGECKCF